MPTVRAAVLPAPSAAIETRELPRPDLEPGAALLRVELSEVCGTDVHLQRGQLDGVSFPFIPGHVSVGHIEEMSGSIRDVDGREFAEGDRVTFLDVHKTCNACWYCLVAKTSTRCPHRKVYGITYGLADGLTGGWAESIYLKPGTRIIRMDAAPSERFMAGGCSLPTALHAVERAQIRIGDRVLVLGSGPVGLSAIILAKMSGATVSCIGAPPSRLEAAEAVGARAVMNFQSHDEDERLEWCRDQTRGRGADVVIEATGAPEAAVQAMRFARDGGRVVVVGQYTDAGEARFNPHVDLNRKHLDVRGCWGSDFSHFYRGVQIMADDERSAPWEKIELKRFSLDAANDALEAVASGEVVKALIDPTL